MILDCFQYTLKFLGLTTPSPSDPSPEASDLSSAGPYQREQERSKTGDDVVLIAPADSDAALRVDEPQVC